MLYQATISVLLLQLTAQVLAVPALATGRSAPGITLAQNVHPQNSTTVIRHPVSNSLITLFIEVDPLETIARSDLVEALYGSRNYIKQELNKHRDDPPPTYPFVTPTASTAENPFNSSPFYGGDCVFVATSGPDLGMWEYATLFDVVQGLMDFTFYPFRAKVGVLTFAVHHEYYGFMGTGALTTRDAAPQA